MPGMAHLLLPGSSAAPLARLLGFPVLTFVSPQLFAASVTRNAFQRQAVSWLRWAYLFRLLAAVYERQTSDLCKH
eukprot:92250-Hanusia_phi.AAC.2